MAVTTAGTFAGSPAGSGLVTANGTTQATAANLAVGFNYVTNGASTGNGLILPAPSGGEKVTIKNVGLDRVGIYPHVGGSLNLGATNANVLMGSNCMFDFYALNSVNWTTAGNCLVGGT